MAQIITVELNVSKDVLSAVIVDKDGKSTTLKIDDASLSVFESIDFETDKPIRVHSVHLSQTQKLDNGFSRTTFWNYHVATPLKDSTKITASLNDHIYLHTDKFSMASRPNSEVQSLIMDKSSFSNKALTVKWAQAHGFKSCIIIETDKDFRLCQKSASIFKSDTFHTIELSKDVKVQLGVLTDESQHPQLQNLLSNFLGQMGIRR